MNSPKETIMMALAITGTVFGITSTVLHFTHNPHDPNNNPTTVIISQRDVVELPYTTSELKTLQYPTQLKYEENTLPKYVHIKGEPYNMLHPINFGNQPNTTESFTWATFEYRPGKTLPICLMKNNTI